MPHEEPLVITLKVGNCIVKRVLVDKGSAMKVMFYITFQQIGFPYEEIVSITTPLVGFDEASMVLIGYMKLEVITGDKLLMIEFAAVNATFPYNIIMARSWIHSMRGIPSTLHQMMR